MKLLVREEEQNCHKPEPLHQSELKKCKFLMNQALDADEAGLKDIAIKLYTDAAEFGLSAVSIRLLHNFYRIFVLPLIAVVILLIHSRWYWSETGTKLSV